jgi:hypothetical protein
LLLQYKKGNNIAVDPNIVCHTEQSEVSILNAVFRSNAFGDVANARCEIKQVLFHSHNRNIHIR